MSIYHFHAQTIARSKGKSATASAAYRSGEKINDERQGMIFDYSRKRGVVHSEILLPAGAPQELRERSTLWNTIEAVEKRKDAQVAREIEISLPAALTREQQIEAARDFCAELVRDGMCADMCIHDRGDGNPHAHIMLSTREITRDGFGKKRRDWNDREKLVEWRGKWEQVANNALERAGINERIDHRSYEAQGIDKEPMIHTSNRADKIAINNEIRARNEEREALRNEYKQIEKQLAEIEREERRPRTPSELRKAKIEEINAEIEEQQNGISKNKERISALYDMREKGAGDIARFGLAMARSNAEEKMRPHNEEIERQKEIIKDLEDNPPALGKWQGLKKLLGVEYYYDEDKQKQLIDEAKEAAREATNRNCCIENDLLREEASIKADARREHDAKHPTEVKERSDLESENQRRGYRIKALEKEREEIEKREAKIEKIGADLALIDRHSTDVKERSAELAAAERLRLAGAAAAKAEPQDIEVLEKLQPKAAQIVELAKEYAVQQAQKKRSRGRGFERD